MAYPRYTLSRAIKIARRSSTDLTLNSTSWANVDTGLDIVLAAVSGDVIEVGLSGHFSNEAVDAYLDVASIVSAAPVNYWGKNAAESATSKGILAWTGFSGVHGAVGGSAVRELSTGDLSSGTVTLRLRYWTASAANKTLRANADQHLLFWARNLGPVDPH